MRKRAVAKAQARPRLASFLPAFALFLTISAMAWFGWWAFWSVR
ncbi:MAG: hypothetical protein QM758_25045 [Armatimonas sp.]